MAPATVARRCASPLPPDLISGARRSGLRLHRRQQSAVAKTTGIAAESPYWCPDWLANTTFHLHPPCDHLPCRTKGDETELFRLEKPSPVMLLRECGFYRMACVPDGRMDGYKPVRSRRAHPHRSAALRPRFNQPSASRGATKILSDVPQTRGRRRLWQASSNTREAPLTCHSTVLHTTRRRASFEQGVW